MGPGLANPRILGDMSISKAAVLYLKLLAVLIIGLLPPLAITWVGWPGALGIGGLAVMGAAGAAITDGLRLGAATSATIALAGAIGMLVRDQPLLVALLMTVLGGV